MVHDSLIYAVLSILEARKRLNAICLKSASIAFLSILGNLARFALLYKWLNPKYCSTMYRNLEMALFRSFSYSVSSVPFVALRLVPFRVHDAVLDLIQGKKLAVRFSKIPLIRKHLFNRFSCMTTAGNAKRKIRTVMMRCRRHFRGQDKSLIDIYRSMFLQPKEGDIIFNCPIRFQIARVFQRLAVLIDFAFRGFALSLFFLQSFIAERMGSRMYQTGINGYAFVDA